MEYVYYNTFAYIELAGELKVLDELYTRKVRVL